MRGYDRDELRDYDDYEEDGGEEYEEKEPPKRTKGELEYLELRQKLKESFRKQMKKDNSNSLADSSATKKLPYDDYGSFFGPSQPAIAQRVIQESKSLLENQHLASRLCNSPHINKNTNKVSNGVMKSSARNVPPKVSQKIVKAQKLKVTRDYSFLLSDDAELPAPKKELPSQNAPVRNSDGQPAQVSGKTRQPLVNGKVVRGSGEDRKLVAGASHLAPKSGFNYKLSSTSKTSADFRKQLSSNSGKGPGQPVGPKGLPSKIPLSTMGNKSSTPGSMGNKSSTPGSMGNKSSMPSSKNPLNGVRKPLSSKLHSSVPRQSVEQRKVFQEQNKPKMVPKQPVASAKSQINKPPLKQIPKRSDLQDHRPKNKMGKRYYDEAEDDMDVSRMIRSMFNYNPNKFVNDDDDDDMEAGFDEIMREERRSAKIAKQEDEEQLRLIEEEERERRRRMAKLKKRKLGR